MTAPSRPLDDQGWAEWCREHAPSVRGYAMAMLRRRDQAEDLVQEVLCRAWQARDRYQEQGTARAYLLTIADRLICDRSRRPRREVNLNEDDWRRHEPSQREMEPVEAVERHEARRQLEAALDLVSPIQRRVLLLRYYGEMSFAEIAETVECPLGTALSHAHRGLAALRKLLVDIP